MKTAMAAVGLVAFLAAGCGSDATEGGTVDAALDGQSADAGPETDGVADDSEPEEGGALPQVCPPELTGCVGGDLLVCNAAGTAFEVVECEDQLFCFEGACVACIDDDDCEPHEICLDGACEVTTLEVVTDQLPPALEQIPYEHVLETTGGVPPYAWSIVQGELPEAIALAEDGTLSGVSEAVGVHPFQVRVDDTADGVATAFLDLEVLDGGLHITTPSPLPATEAGEPYETWIEVMGGTPPYIFGVVEGSLPAGLALGSNGRVDGMTEVDGWHTFDVRAFDSSVPTLTDTKTFELLVTIAPIEILGDQEVDLFITKLIVLPLIIVVQDVPVPYNAELKAKGGRKPYHWSEQPMPGFVQGLIPNAGLPDGLTVNDGGTVTGAVTDTSLVVSVSIPFTGIALTGFFFSARVEDSQPVADDATALYIIPTVPIGGP